MTVRIVGAGLSGLAAALHLVNSGHTVEVIEASDRPGGLIETRPTPFGPVDVGASAFVWDRAVGVVFDTIAMTPRFAVNEAVRRRFIFRDGKPRRWPLNPHETAAMMLHRARVAACRQSLPRPGESVADWSRRTYGAAAARWLVSPAFQGTYAAPAERLAAHAILSIGTHRPLARRARLRLAAPPGGMADFIDRLEAHLRQRGVSFSYGHRVETLDPQTPTIVTTSARSAAALVAPHAPELGAALAAVPFVGLVLTAMTFRPHPNDQRGFGVLFPRECGIRSLGVRFDSDIFPRGEYRAETWIGEEDGQLSDAEVRGAAIADRRRLTGRSDEPLHVVTVRRPGALPLYDSSVTDARRWLPTLPPWLGLAGNYLGRLGVSALVEAASDAASRMTGSHSGNGSTIRSVQVQPVAERRPDVRRSPVCPTRH